MKYYYFLLAIPLIILSCKPYTSTKVRRDQVTYTEFREQQKSFSSEDGVIKYIDRGEGPVILLLHGVPTSGWLYRKMIDPLVAGGYRVIAPDMLGFGSSDSPEGYDLYNEANHAKRLLALMDSLDITSWTHAMHDAGGLWTWELFKAAPDRIEQLIILNTVIFDEGFYPPIPMKPGGLAKTAMWTYRNGMTTNVLLKKLFQTGLSENTLNETDVEGYKTPLREGKTKAMYYFFTQTCNDLPDYSEVFSSIEAPKLLIWGIHDDMLQWTPQQTRVTETFGIKEENIHLIDEKHFIQETKNKKIVKLMLNFLKPK